MPSDRCQYFPVQPLEDTANLFHESTSEILYEHATGNEDGLELPWYQLRAKHRRVRVEYNGPDTEIFDDFNRAVWPGLCHQAYTMSIFPKEYFQPDSKFLNLDAQYQDKYTFGSLRDGVKETVSWSDYVTTHLWLTCPK